MTVHRRLTLRQRQVLLLLVVAIPFTITLLVGIYWSYHSVFRRAATQLAILGELHRTRLSLWIQEQTELLTLMAEDLDTSAGRQELDLRLNALRDRVDDVQALALVDPLHGARIAGSLPDGLNLRDIARRPGPPADAAHLPTLPRLVHPAEGTPLLALSTSTPEGPILVAFYPVQALARALGVDTVRPQKTDPDELHPQVYLIGSQGWAIPLSGPTAFQPVAWTPPADASANPGIAPDGRPALGRMIWVSNAELGLLLVQPTTELTAALRSMWFWTAAGTLGLLAVSLFALWRMSGVITDALTALAQAIHSLRDERPPTLRLTGSPELEQVGQAFNQTAQELHTLRTKLEHQIRLRTAALAAKEARYRQLIEMAPLAIALHDGQKVVYANPGTLRILRATTADQVVGRPITDFLHPDEWPVAQDRIRRLRAGHPDVYPVIYRMRRLDGTEFLGEVTAAVFQEPDGTILHQLTLRDVSAERVREREVALFQELAQGILENRPLEDLIWTLYRGCSQLLPLDTFYLAILDRQRNEYTTPIFVQRGENLGSFTRSLDRESLTAYVIRTRRPLLIRDTGDPAQVPATPQRIASPPERLCYMAVPLIHGEEVLGVLSAQNFTPNAYGDQELALLDRLGRQIALALVHARQLRAIRDQAERLERILETVPEGVVVTDADHRVQMVNPAAQALLDRLATFDATGRLTHLLGHPVAKLQDDVLYGDGVELTWEGPPTCIVHLVGRPLEIDGQYEGCVLVLRDVTEMRQQEKQLQMQERLATVGQLAAGIAHDFNNILGIITLYSQMLQAHPNHPQWGRHLATIEEQAKHAAKLIGQILDFSRRSIMERTTFDLVPFLKETVRILERTLPEHIQVTLETPNHPLRVHADLGRIQQVLMNLAVNARDAMPEGGQIAIRLTAEPAAEGNGQPGPPRAVIRFADTGHGIPHEHLDQIFNPFFTTKPPGQGTGLGLAQVYGIVKQHGGDIQVESRVGRGTVFTFWLPMQPDPAEEAHAMRQWTPTDRPATVLLVEDNPVAREAMAEILEMLGYRVVSAADGEEALARFQTDPTAFDLVLSDVVMPRMGGRDLFRALRALNPQIRVILMSGYPLDEAGQDLLAEGVVDWLQKPVSVDILAERLRGALDYT